MRGGRGSRYPVIIQWVYMNLYKKVASKVTSCGSRRVLTADLQDLLGPISGKELGRIFLKRVFLNLLDPS